MTNEEYILPYSCEEISDKLGRVDGYVINIKAEIDDNNNKILSFTDNYTFNWEELIDVIENKVPVRCNVYNESSDDYHIYHLSSTWIDDGYISFNQIYEMSLMSQIEIYSNGEICYYENSIQDIIDESIENLPSTAAIIDVIELPTEDI